MNTKIVEKNWVELKGKILARFDKLNSSDVEDVKSDIDQISGKIQKAYGLAQDSAVHQFEEFKKTVQSLIGQVDDRVETPNRVVAGTPTLHSN